MPEFSKDNDAVLIYPVNETEDEILQVGPSGKLEMVSTKDMVGLKTDFELKMSSYVKSDPVIFIGLKKHGWS